jgi:hypothetical protein
MEVLGIMQKRLAAPLQRQYLLSHATLLLKQIFWRPSRHHSVVALGHLHAIKKGSWHVCTRWGVSLYCKWRALNWSSFCGLCLHIFVTPNVIGGQAGGTGVQCPRQWKLPKICTSYWDKPDQKTGAADQCCDMRGPNLSPPLPLEWIRQANFPFQATHHLLNPHNNNRPVQTSCDGQVILT